MTTNNYIPDYNYDRRRDDTRSTPKQTGSIPNRTKNGLYNIIEKDYNQHKVLYYVPSSYGNDYDISELEEELFHPEQPKYDTPVGVRQQYHQPSGNRKDDYSPSSRRDMHVSSKRPVIIKRIYFHPQSPPPPPPPTPQKIVYVYKKAYIPKNEYIVHDRASRRKYVEEMRPIRRTVYVENLPQQASPRFDKSPRLNLYSSPRRPRMTQSTSRETPIRIISRNTNEQNYISLKQVLAENQARRSLRKPKLRREVDEEQSYDLPTYRKNFVKNNFLVHK